MSKRAKVKSARNVSGQSKKTRPIRKRSQLQRKWAQRMIRRQRESDSKRTRKVRAAHLRGEDDDHAWEWSRVNRISKRKPATQEANLFGKREHDVVKPSRIRTGWQKVNR